jgi:hypothetical protein
LEVTTPREPDQLRPGRRRAEAGLSEQNITLFRVARFLVETGELPEGGDILV